MSEKNLRTILVVDDEERFLNSIRRMLFDYPFDIDTAPSVDIALEYLTKKTYDMILLDYAMPKKTGLDFMKEAKWDRSLTKVILITGHLSPSLADEFYSLGIDGYMGKPFTQEDLLGLLEYHLPK